MWLSTKSESLKMLSTERLVCSARFWSHCSLSLVIEKAKSTGMEVNRDFTSKETMTSSLEMDHLLCFVPGLKTISPAHSARQVFSHSFEL